MAANTESVGKGCRIDELGIEQAMSDPKHAAAALAGPRATRQRRAVGWGLAVLAWAAASDARPLLALLSLLAAATLRCVYVVTSSSGTGRSTFWSAWFFAVAAAAELAWLVARAPHL